MANFLDDLSIYNAKAAAAISAAVVECNNEKANMMSSLKTTANDITLSEEIRLNALTALINLGNLLDIPLPPYFPSVTTYALTETFVGVHNDLDGLQGGAPGEYYHLTAAEKTAILNKASLGDISWANLSGNYSDNVLFGPLFDAKQDGLVAPAAGTYFVKVTGSTVSYDSNSYITTISGIAAGGELDGFYPDPNLSNAAVIGKVLTGWNGSVTGTITATDTILQALQKLNGNLNAVIASPGGVASVALTNNAPLVFTTTTTPQTGAASLSLGLNTQNANLLLASPNGTNGLPLFRALDAADLPNSGVTAATYGSSTVIPQIQVDAKGRITGVTSITAASGGQVNTVGLSVPGILSPSFVNAGTPSDPIITLALDVQTANYVWAGPETGADAVPSFRLLVEDDIPQLSTSKITNLTNILNNYLTNELSNGSIWIGNTSNAAVPCVLSGDVTVSNTGVTAIGLAKVQYDMIQNVTSQTLLGNYELTDGPVQQITLSADFVLNSGSGVLSLSSPVAPVVTTQGDLLGHNTTTQARVPSNNINGSILLVNDSATGAYTNLGLNWVAMSGDATIIASGAITIANNAVTLGKIQQLPAFTVIGNDTSGTATPTALSKTELTALIEQFNVSASGAVPATGAAAGDTTKFLNAAGGWTVPAGGGGGSGTVNAANQYSIPYYSTAGSATVLSGLAPQTTNGVYFLRANVTASAAVAPDWLGSTGTGNVVLATSPTLVTPILGVASATSINKVAITAPATSATLTIADSKTLTASNTLTFTGTDSSSVAFGAGGTVAYVGLANSWTSGIKQTFAPSATTAGVNVGTLAGQPSLPANGDLVYNSTATALQAYINGAWVSLGSGGGGGSGTVVSGAVNNLAYYSVSPSGTTVSSLGSLGTSTQVLHGNASGIPTWGAVALASDVSGTLPVGNGGTGATTLTGLLRGAGTTAITGSATVALGSEVSGTLPVGNGGTGLSTNTAYAVVLGGTTNGGVLTQVASLGSSGQVLTSTGPSSPPTFQTGGGSVALNNVLASTGGVSILNTTSTITWNWNSNTTTNAFVLNSSLMTTGAILAVTHSSAAFTAATGVVSFASTSVTSGTILSVAHTASSLTGNVASFTSTTVTTGAVLNLGISGTTASSAKNLVITNSATTASSTARGLDIQMTNASSGGNTIGAFISNTKTATTNTAIQLTASGATTNYAIDVVSGISRFAAGTATVPQIVLSPSSLNGSLTGTTNGSIWYDTTTASSNSSLYLYKDSGLTKFITLDRNIDFSAGTSGVIQSDANGNLTKGADLTALGIFAAYDTVTIPGTITTATTIVSPSLVGSKTLPANFFAVGKTIQFRASGMFTLVAARTLTLRVSISSLNIDIVIDHGNLISNRFFDFLVSVTCKAISGSNSTYIYTIASNAVHDANGGNILFGNGADSGSLAINTASTIATDMLAFFDASDGTDTITIYQASAQYLN